MRTHTAIATVLAFGAAMAPAMATAQDENIYIALPDYSQPVPDPDYEPRTDPRSDRYDPNYDPSTDPGHPSRQDQDPGEAWDNPRRADGTPGIRTASGDWVWGELRYGTSYKTKLKLTNKCTNPETVTLTTSNLPWISVPGKVTIPGKSSVDLDITIVIPPMPKITFLTGHENLGPDPFFVDIKGDKEELKVWHPWNGDCLPKREIYKVSGHIHPGEPDSDSDPGPQRLATTPPCRVWWNTGERPAQAKEDCTDSFRKFAVHYREKIVQGFATRDPAAWAWLPSSPQIRDMSASELLAMKQRADAQARDA